MVSYAKKKGQPTDWYAPSTDTKPTYDVGNGDMLIEMDTGKLYFYDADGAEWKEWTQEAAE